MENQAKINAATDELAVLEFEIDALQSAHGLPVDEDDLAAKQRRALALYAELKQLRNTPAAPQG
ncbi:hypothetical protein SAMN02745146_0342 [Hymenobacter daecheongensis DSM 21074]|uniref:Uncharacterized protein n=1 Tax=Hymenobacter daecheongensis DSM 21074 TaxID=1121955 RepID=A0A1M6MNP1_9BACT|nr:hypothetical protein [Hymenobacter daecheongensis]SHJ85062.1 hypothetical protein SAMN02745146_0342 [Hymenobacter daecheongensis DSM 21074]